MKQVNAWLEGFRTILLALAGYALLFVDVFFTNLTGFSEEALKGAAYMAILIAIKQFKTDAIPKLKERLAK